MAKTTIDQITERDADIIIEEIDKMRKAIKERLGIVVKTTTVHYSDDEFNVTLNGYTNPAELSLSPRLRGWQLNFNKQCFKYGMTPDDYGNIRSIDGTHYRLVNVASRKSKRPIVIQSVEDENKIAKCSENMWNSAALVI